MSSGKETPRQKMVGMMYLVLTALLALNVSKQILKGFVTVDENIEKSKEILAENNTRLKETFEAYVNNGNAEAKPYLLKAIEAQKYTTETNAYLDSMKMMVISKTEKMQKPDTAQIRYMERLDDYDTPTYLLIGDDESSLKTTKYSAKALRGEMNGLYEKLNTLVDGMQKDPHTKIDEAELKALKEKLATIMPVDRNIDDDGVKLNWELENFYHLPMAAVVTNLDKMQADIRNIESEFLHVFSAAGAKPDVRTNKLVARVMAPSAYVQTGEAFRADILLSAGSTDLPADRMKVLVGAKYDPVTKKFTASGQPVNINEGIGKYETVASGQGEKTVEGVVVYKNTKGVEEYYPFDYKYIVAAPFTAVAADNMNVFYVGVSNPISVSSAGFSPADLVVNVSGCGARAKQVSPGKYELEATSAGTCVVSVSAKTAGGLKPQGAPKVFRVRTIPQPIGKVNGRFALSTLDFSKNEMSGIAGLGAESMGFQFPVNVIVVSYDIDVKTAGGDVKSFKSDGANLPGPAKTAIANLRSGQKVWFENIKVKMPGSSSPVPIPNITLRQK